MISILVLGCAITVTAGGKTQFQAKTCNKLHSLPTIVEMDLFEATKEFNSHTVSAQKLTFAIQNDTEGLFQLLLYHCWLWGTESETSM